MKIILVNLKAFTSFLCLAAVPAWAQSVISISPARTTEGNQGTQSVLVPVHLSAAAGAGVSAAWTTESGTAQAGADFTAASGTVTFAPGETYKTISVNVTGDLTGESDEAFSIVLSNPQGGNLGASQARVLIQNDEPFSILGLPENPQVLEKSLPNTQPLTAMVGNPQPGKSVALSLSSGTATAGSDISVVIPSLGLNAAEPVLPLRGVDDSIAEADETFTLNAATSDPTVKMIPGKHLTTLQVGATPSTMALEGDTLATADGTSVRIFRKSGGTWAQEQIISAVTEGGVKSVALDQGIIAADFLSTGVKIFAFTGGQWTLQATIPRTTSPADDRRRVVLSDDTLAVSDPAASGQTATGEVRVYERHRGGRNAWGLRQVLTPPAAQTEFGTSVAIWGDYIVTASPADYAAYLFRRAPASGTWSRVKDLPLYSWDSSIGCAISGGRLLISTGNTLYGCQRLDTSGLSWGELTYTGLPAFGGASYAISGNAVASMYLSTSITVSAFTPNGAMSVGGTVSPVNANGIYLSSALAYDGTTLVVPNLQGPETAVLLFYEPLTSVTGTVLDDDSVSFSVSNITIEEGTGAYVTVQLSRPLPAQVSVLCTTVDGTAAATSDYQWNSAWVTFSAGSTAAQFFVDTFADGVAEGNETFQVVPELASVGVAGSPGVITITDPPPPGAYLSSSAYSVTEGNAGLTPVTITAYLTKAAQPGSSFRWQLASGTATAGTDFPVAGGTVQVPSGANSVEFQVAVNGDDICEPSETMSLQLSEPVNLELGYPSAAQITILNDDAGTPTPDSYTVAQNTVLSGVNVRSNDCSTLPVSVAQTTARGTLVLSSSGAFVYTPQVNFIGTDTFTYNGGGGGSGGSGELDGTDLVTDTAEFRWFNPLNGIDPNTTNPSWNDGWFLPAWDDSGWGTGSGLMGYGQMSSSLGPLNPNTDIGTPTTGMRRSAYFRHKFNVPQAGVYDLDLSISRDDAAIVYINGAEVVRSHEAGAVAIVTAPDRWDLMIEGNSTAFTALNNEGDPYTHRLTGVALTAGLNTLAISGHNSLNPTSATSSDLGVKVFYLRVVSGGGPPPASTPVTIQVTDAQQVPVLTADTYSLTEDQVLNTLQSAAAPVLANDGLFDSGGTAYDPLLEAEVQDVTHGTVSGWNPLTGHFIFTPAPDFNGVASFRYRVRDKDGWSQPALVTVNVAGDLALGAMTRLNPPGSQLFRSVTSLTFPATGVADAAVSLKAGQTLSLRAGISGTLSSLEVRPPGGAALPGGTAGPNSLQNVPIPADGVYVIAGGGVTGGTGAGTLTLLVNGGLPGQPNDWLNPLPLEASRPAGSPRAAVSATMAATAAVPHYYGITGAAGETVHLYLQAAGAMPFTLQNFSGAELAASTVSPHAASATYLSHTFAAASIYRVSIPSANGADYTLQLYRGSATHEYAAAQPAPASVTSAGHLQGPGGVETGVTFAAFGDYGSGSSNEAAVATMVKSWNPDFIVAVGDHNYTNNVSVGAPAWTNVIGNFYGDYILGRQDNFYPEQRSATQRFFTVPGNHDTGPNSANGGELSGYFDYFYSNPGGTPRLPAGVFEPMLTYYKMNWGNMEFYFIDSDNGVTNAAAATAQRQWMRAQLDASTARWKFAVWHHPPYSSSAVHGNHPAFQWGADFQGLTAIITGHDHIYERLDAGYGVTQFVTGLGGMSIYPFGSAVPQSLFRYNSTYGAMKIRTGSSGVQFEFRSIGATGGNLIDSYTIGTPPGNAVPTGTDTWTLRVHPGQVFRLTTRTPAAAGALTNTADPAIEVRDTAGTLVAQDTGSAPDSINASLLVTVPDIPNCPPEGCLWTVKVYNESTGSGEYELTATAPPAAEYYEAWAALRLPAGSRGIDQDPDMDDAPNLMEFLAGTDPVAATPGTPLSMVPTGIAGMIRLHMALPSGWSQPVTVQLQRSSTMAPGTWQTLVSKSPGAPWVSSGLPSLPTAAPGGGFHFISTTGQRSYFRLHFTLATP